MTRAISILDMSLTMSNYVYLVTETTCRNCGKSYKSPDGIFLARCRKPPEDATRAGMRTATEYTIPLNTLKERYKKWFNITDSEVDDLLPTLQVNQQTREVTVEFCQECIPKVYGSKNTSKELLPFVPKKYKPKIEKEEEETSLEKLEREAKTSNVLSGKLQAIQAEQRARDKKLNEKKKKKKKNNHRSIKERNENKGIKREKHFPDLEELELALNSKL